MSCTAAASSKSSAKESAASNALKLRSRVNQWGEALHGLRAEERLDQYAGVATVGGIKEQTVIVLCQCAFANGTQGFGRLWQLFWNKAVGTQRVAVDTLHTGGGERLHAPDIVQFFEDDRLAVNFLWIVARVELPPVFQFPGQGLRSAQGLR